MAVNRPGWRRGRSPARSPVLQSVAPGARSIARGITPPTTRRRLRRRARSAPRVMTARPSVSDVTRGQLLSAHAVGAPVKIVWYAGRLSSGRWRRWPVFDSGRAPRGSRWVAWSASVRSKRVALARALGRPRAGASPHSVGSGCPKNSFGRIAVERHQDHHRRRRRAGRPGRAVRGLDGGRGRLRGGRARALAGGEGQEEGRAVRTGRRGWHRPRAAINVVPSAPRCRRTTGFSRRATPRGRPRRGPFRPRWPTPSARGPRRHHRVRRAPNGRVGRAARHRRPRRPLPRGMTFYGGGAP